MTPVQCPGCHATIGHEVHRGHLILIQVGPLVLRELHGVCSSCGTAVHYSVADRVIVALLREPGISAILATSTK